MKENLLPIFERKDVASEVGDNYKHSEVRYV